jgi:hypothetical protein
MSQNQIVATVREEIDRYRTSILYRRVCFDIITSDYNYYTSMVINDVERSLSNNYNNQAIPRRVVVDEIEYTIISIALNVLNNERTRRLLDPDEERAAIDMQYRLGELSDALGYQQNNGNNQATRQGGNYGVDPSGLFVRGSNPQAHRNQSEQPKGSGFSLDSLRNKGGIASVLRRNKEKASSEGNPNGETVAKPEEPKTINRYESIYGTYSGITPLPSRGGTVSTPTCQESSTPNTDNIQTTDRVLDKGSTEIERQQDKVIVLKWELVEQCAMSEEDKMDYIKHELTPIEQERVAAVSKYGEKATEIVKQQQHVEKKSPVIKTEDVFLTNKIVYTSSIGELSGGENYYKSIQESGKGLVSVIGEYGDCCGIYSPSGYVDTIRNELLGLHEKPFTLTDFNRLFATDHQAHEDDNSGLLLRNIIEQSVQNWVHDITALPAPSKEEDEFVLAHDLEHSLKGYIKDILDVNGAYSEEYHTKIVNRLMDNVNSLGKYIPTFKSLQDLHLENIHLPIMDMLPNTHYSKCIVPIYYKAIVRLPINFKALGVDTAKVEDKHFIAKRSNFGDFYMLENMVFSMAKSLDNKVNNITLDITDISEDRLTFKRIDKPIAIMSII